MMGIMVPETCWASNKICNKNHLLHLVGILVPQTFTCYFFPFNNQPVASIIQIYSFIKFYMFRASSLPVIRSFLLCFRHR
jgi:hypothetical protein